MHKNIRQYFIIITIILAFHSCSKDDVLEENPISRTIIVYMAADNDLSDDARNNLEEIKQSYTGRDVNLLVFADLQDENPFLLKVNKESSEIIQTYPELNSADPVVLREILSGIIEMYPADELGLILWSHGTSWLPAGSRLRSFGDDRGRQMNITDLAKNLPARFDFILFDACLMGSVEVAYELKDKTGYIIASSTETIYEGFPYGRIIPELLRPTINLRAVAQHYFDFYNAKHGAYRSATISVIDAKQLTGLAEAMKQIATENNINSLFDRKTVQRLDTYDEQYVFDLADFIRKAYPGADTQFFTQQLNRSILYKNSTPIFWSMFEIKTYCGLSCYIPHPGRDDLNAYYRTLQWYKDTEIN